MRERGMVQSAAEGEAAKEKKSDDEGENPNGETKKINVGADGWFFLGEEDYGKKISNLWVGAAGPLFLLVERKSCVF